MLREKRQSRQKRLLQDTCESIPRSLPKKVEQQTIKRNYQQLKMIPEISHAEHIKHLYLSHNKIVNLKGIEAFVCLQTLNVSYNCLEQVQQLRRIANPLQLRHLKIRMNPLQFGYQDYAVSLFQNLKTFQDIKLRKQAKEHLQIMRDYVSQNILSFMTITKKFRDILNMNQLGKENCDYVNTKNPTRTIDFADLNISFLDKLKELYTFPTEQVIRSCSISGLLSKVYRIMQTFCQATVHKGQNNKEQYLKQTRQSYAEVVELILLKYSAKYDKTLVNYLKKIEQQLNLRSYSQAFSKLGVFVQQQGQNLQVKMSGGALKSPLMNGHPAKYIQKIDVNAIRQHPMNKLANWQLPQNLNTLIPLQQTKWYHFYNKKDLNEQENQLFQQMPMFIYCKTYLQVISEIILDRVSQILNKQNEIVRFKEFQARMANQTVIYRPIEEEIQFQLSRSDALSFGDKQNRIIQISNLQERDQKETKINIGSKLHSFTQKTVPKQRFFVSREHKKLQKDQAYNIEKYSLHEINLAFKVFRGFKKRINKRKGKLIIQH